MQVNVLCHVEKLPDFDADNRWFSLNLTVGLEDQPAVDVPKLLSPWTWTIAKVALYTVESETIDPAKMITANVIRSDMDTAGIARLATRLESIYADFDGKKRLVWKATDQKTLDRNGDSALWSDFLIHASTFPAALAHSLNLSCVFKVDRNDVPAGADRIVAVPLIDFGDGGGVREPKKATKTDLSDQTNELRHVAIGSTGLDQPPFFYVWDYAGTTPDVKAYQRECVLDATSAGDQFFDPKSGWVLKKGKDVVTEDWALVLESRLAEAFDLPLRLLDAFGKNLPAQADEKSAEDAVLASLRDVAGTGGRKPRGQRIAADLVAKMVQDSVLAEKARKALENYKPDLAGWKKLLAPKVPTRLYEVKTDGSIVDGDITPFPARLAELRRIHGELSREETLRELLLAEWAEAFKGDQQLLTFLSANMATLRDALAGISLRTLHRFETLQESWPDLSALAISATADEQQKLLRTKLADALVAYLKNRFGAQDATTPYGTFTPRVVPIADAVKLEAELKAYAGSLPIIQGAVDEQESLVIQLADVIRKDNEDASTEEEQNDSARRMSGYGVLLRKESEPKWSCLNMALVVDADTLDPFDARPLPVPLRLGYRNGVRQSFVIYENRPLIAESPMQLAMSYQLREQSGAEAGLDPFFAYRNPYGKGNDAGNLAPLIYGVTYKAAAFAIGHAGALPLGLARGTENGASGTITPWLLPADMTRPNVPAGAERTLVFRRRTPVGLPRAGAVALPAKAFEKLTLPPIPSTVLPLARSLAEAPKDGEQGAGQSRPLLLMRNGDSAFSFRLQAPSVDLNVWDRWVALNGEQPRRIAVWKEYHEFADKAGVTMKADATNIDLTLDDPAVTSFLFRVTHVETKAVVAEKTVTLQPSGSGGIGLARSKPVAVSVAVDAGLAAPKIDGTTSVTVSFPLKNVWTLEVFPVVAETDFKRFAKDVKTAGMFGQSALFQPFALAVETAPKVIPFDPKELFNALKADLDRGKNRDDLVIRFDPASLGDSGRWMHRVETVIQQWRWSGRPIARANAAGSDLDDNLDLGRKLTAEDDAVLFSDRSPLDVLLVPSLVDFVASKDVVELHRREVTQTKGALYFRVAVRCFSRYEGFVDGVADSRTGAAGEPEQWQRFLVKARWKETDAVPRPVVKLIVPLTRPIGDDRTPPLLAVLDEPWGDVGGLAERFVADVVKVVPDHPRTETFGTLPELGPDPILTVSQDTRTFVFANAPVGPIGYTFDTDTDAPLFVKSSFIIRPPVERTAGGQLQPVDLSWYFAKLQFRRVLDRNGMFGEPKDDPASEPTSPVWCQFLPPSTRFGGGDVTGLTIAAKGGAVILADGNGKGVQPLPLTPGSGTSKAKFELFALVTEPIADAAGRPDQEAYVGLYTIDEQGALLPHEGSPALTARELRVRLIEVQRRASITGAKSLWDELFPQVATDKPDEADAVARIVRISPPIGASS